ncbi:MAG TPA: UDP-glucose 4-epimerase GalE [Oculatellaceae cyanobacterium]
MILVTGGAGYIGSHFVYRAIKRDTNINVVILDNFSEGCEEAVRGWERVHVVHGDMGDKDIVNSTLKKYPIEAVVHFAAHCYVGESQSQPFKYFQNNVSSSLVLFEAMEQHGLRKIVFSSSCATYGVPQYSPIDEKHPQNPINNYGMTKLLAEQILFRLAATAGWSTVCLRYFNASGAEPEAKIGESHNPETHLLPRILQAATGKLDSIDILGTDYPTRDGTCIRDYIHVNDLADAHIASLDLIKSAGNSTVAEAINLGTATGNSVREVIERCKQISGRNIKVREEARRPGDPPELVANAAKAKTLLNWQPQYTLDDIINSAWHWELDRRY